MTKLLTIILGSALAAGLPAPAFAQDAVNTSIVRTADLDLNSAAGQRALRQRVAVAAHTVCDGASATDLKALNGESECRQQVSAAALSRVQALAQRGEKKAILLASGN